MKLEGKVALVTGSSRGIGAAIASAFAHEGAKLVVNYSKSAREANEVVNRIKQGGGEAIAIRATVSSRVQVSTMIDRTMAEFGRIDILVNNAGHSTREVWFAPLDRITPAMWAAVVNTDLKGTFLCCQAVAKPMLRQGAGKIINISSTPALTGDTRGLLYSTAKAGILGLTKSLARVLAPKIQVNVMALGSVRTGWIDWLRPDELQALIDETALKRLGQPDEIGKVAVFLASEDSDFITGQTIVANGGAYLH